MIFLSYIGFGTPVFISIFKCLTTDVVERSLQWIDRSLLVQVLCVKVRFLSLFFSFFLLFFSIDRLNKSKEGNQFCFPLNKALHLTHLLIDFCVCMKSCMFSQFPVIKIEFESRHKKSVLICPDWRRKAKCFVKSRSC